MSKVGLSGLLIAAIGLIGCNTTRHGVGKNDGQSHWLHACQSSSECGDAQCVCGLCSRSCTASSECGGGPVAQCVEIATLGSACGGQAATAKNICWPSTPVPAGAGQSAGEAGQSVLSAGSSAPPRAGANSVGTPDAGGAGTQAADAAVDAGAIDASIPFDRAVCDEYDSVATPSPTTVRIVNGTLEQLYLGPTQMFCGAPPLFTLETAQGEPVYGYGGNCAFTCKQLQLGQCICLPVCDFGQVISLMPGEQFEIPWQGTQFASEVMPDGCYPAESCRVGAPCAVERTIEETLTVRAAAYPEVSCGEGVTCMPCMPGGAGNCMVFDGKNVLGTPRTASATWNPGQATVTLRF